MAITNKSTEYYEVELGEQVRRLRIDAGYDQKQLSEAANISVGALKNLENGKGSSISTMIKIMRALNVENWLESLSPQITVSPMQMLRDLKMNAPRRRVFRSRKDV